MLGVYNQFSQIANTALKALPDSNKRTASNEKTAILINEIHCEMISTLQKMDELRAHERETRIRIY